MTPAPQLLHSPAVLLQKAVPYKRLLAVLVRSSCVSLAISNEQLNMAEPLG